MNERFRHNIAIGLFFLAFALLVAVVWVPLDTETGLIEKVRRQTNIGDALAPTVGACIVGLGGLLLLLFERNDPAQPGIGAAHIRFIGLQIAVLALGFLIMLYAGPALVALSGGDADYRALRDTAPWKYVGYFLGGVVIVSGLISQAEGRFSARNLLIGIGVTLAMIALYDLPFEDLLLPPNGDV